MIELPEATVIARQLGEAVAGKRIASAVRGNAPHKFAFYSRPAEEYAAALAGRTVGRAAGHGPAILVPVEPDCLVLGGGGERILLHRDEGTLPKKHHLLLRFEDGAALTVTVQGWGNVLLLDRAGMAEHPHVGQGRVAALADAFTPAYFGGLFESLAADDARSVKAFVISEPGAWGVGNGCLQDVLFRARIHPRRRAADLTCEERRALYDAIRQTLGQMVELGGRDSERDLYDRPGGYHRILDSRSVGQPCPTCGTPIVKIQYLGGACTLCPGCQV